MKEIKVAIVGIGNCASALIQGVEFYKNNKDVARIGVEDKIGDYGLENITFSLGFEVNKNKVNLNLEKAIFVEPNCAEFLYIPQTSLGKVYKGEVLDGLDSNIKNYVAVDDAQKVENVSTLLKTNNIDVVIICLPTGSQKSAEYYAKEAILAGCAVLNGMPADIANNKSIVDLAIEHNVPIIGDDIKSQIGATIIHRALTNLFPMRSAVMERTLQLDWGGDMDFCNLMSNDRYNTGGKRRSKTESVIYDLPNKDSVDAQISAVDYIPFLKNQKEAYTRIEGKIFGGKSVRIDVMMQVQDGYNSAGILVDALRVLKIAKDRGLSGVINEGSSFFNKRPPIQVDDVTAKANLKKFLK